MSRAIAQFGGRLEALHFGVADYAACMRARTTNIGGLNPHYPGDQWHAAISRMVIACRAYGLRAIDGPFGDFSATPKATWPARRRAAALGCEGKWAIHPCQVALANEVFCPPDGRSDQGPPHHRGTAQGRSRRARAPPALDGKMIDAASRKDGAQRAGRWPKRSPRKVTTACEFSAKIQAVRRNFRRRFVA